VSRSILGMPMFRKFCSPLHQGEEQPDTEMFLWAILFISRYLLEWGRGRGEKNYGSGGGGKGRKINQSSIRGE